MPANHKVFVLEDENDISRLVRHPLELAGYPVRTFSRAAHGLTESQRERPENPRYLRTVRGAGYRFEVPK